MKKIIIIGIILYSQNVKSQTDFVLTNHKDTLKVIVLEWNDTRVICDVNGKETKFKANKIIGFKEITSDFIILYDEFEFLFRIKDIKGFCFTFNNFSLSSDTFKSSKISKLIVYDIKMDEFNDLLGFDQISTDNINNFMEIKND